MIRFYKMDGTPYTGNDATIHWIRDLAHFDNNVKKETLENGIFISTIWIGLDQNCEDGPPLIFETMVLKGGYIKEIGMYSTKDEALNGHNEMVRKWSS
jgi:hypothetical protein